MLYTKDSSIIKFAAHVNHILTYLEASSEALALLGRHGFAADRLYEGRVMLEQLQSAINQLEQRAVGRKAATDGFHQEWSEFRKLHQVHLQAARRAFGREAEQILGRRPNNYMGWLTEVRSFYNVVLGNFELQAKLNALGISSEELQRASQRLDTMVSNKDQQNQRRHELGLIQQQRMASYLELKQWFLALSALARVAFRRQPAMRQMMRALSSQSNQQSTTLNSSATINPINSQTTSLAGEIPAISG